MYYRQTPREIKFGKLSLNDFIKNYKDGKYYQKELYKKILLIIYSIIKKEMNLIMLEL